MNTSRIFKWANIVNPGIILPNCRISQGQGDCPCAENQSQDSRVQYPWSLIALPGHDNGGDRVLHKDDIVGWEAQREKKPPRLHPAAGVKLQICECNSDSARVCHQFAQPAILPCTYDHPILTKAWPCDQLAMLNFQEPAMRMKFLRTMMP